MLDPHLSVLYSTLLLHVPYVPPADRNLEILASPMVDEYSEPPISDTPVSPAIAAHVPNDPNGPSCSTSIAQDAPSASHSSTSSYFQSPSVHQGTAVDDSFEVNSFPPPNDVLFNNTLAPEFSSVASY